MKYISNRKKDLDDIKYMITMKGSDHLRLLEKYKSGVWLRIGTVGIFILSLVTVLQSLGIIKTSP